MSQHIIRIGKYIRSLEIAFQAPGWEHEDIKRNVTECNKYITGGLVILALIA
jgi:hypothetical protein